MSVLCYCLLPVSCLNHIFLIHQRLKPMMHNSILKKLICMSYMANCDDSSTIYCYLYVRGVRNLHVNSVLSRGGNYEAPTQDNVSQCNNMILKCLHRRKCTWQSCPRCESALRNPFMSVWLPICSD
jgi:hypothetical protein